MTHLSTHVLDTTLGRPAVGVPVGLVGPAGDLLASGVTDADGRVAELGPERLPAGDYRLTFDTAAWFAGSGVEAFFPSVTITFRVPDPPAEHYHVPLLLSPFAFTTYRGS